MPLSTPASQGYRYTSWGKYKQHMQHKGLDFCGVDTTLCSVCHLIVQPGAVSEAHLEGGGAHDPVGGGAQHAHHRHQVVPGQISRYIYLSRPGYLRNMLAGTRWLLATLFSLNLT